MDKSPKDIVVVETETRSILRQVKELLSELSGLYRDGTGRFMKASKHVMAIQNLFLNESSLDQALLKEIYSPACKVNTLIDLKDELESRMNDHETFIELLAELKGKGIIRKTIKDEVSQEIFEEALQGIDARIQSLNFPEALKPPATANAAWAKVAVAETIHEVISEGYLALRQCKDDLELALQLVHESIARSSAVNPAMATDDHQVKAVITEEIQHHIAQIQSRIDALG